jgi:Tfp pilus assembly protein PilF
MSYPGGADSTERRRFGGGLSRAVILATVLAVGIGCGFRAPGLGREGGPDQSFQGAAEETARLLRTAHYYKLMGRPEVALKGLEEAHRLAPGNLKVANTLAQLYDELGMGPQAQQIYQEALVLAPGNPVLLNNLGFSYYLGADWSQAEKCFRQALACQPSHQGARNNLGLLLCRQGHRQEARKLWQEAEGEAAAEKMAQVLAALGLADEPLYAQQSRPPSGKQALRAHSPLDRQLARNSLTPTKPPLNLPAPSPAVKGSVEPLPEVGPAKLAAQTPKQKGLESSSGTAPASQPGGARVAAAPPLPRPAASGLSSGEEAARPVPAVIAMAAAPSGPVPDQKTATPEKSRQPATQPGPASQPVLHRSISGTFQERPGADRPAYLTAGELAETNIAILNGNGIHDLARDTRSRLSLEGFSVAAIGNFRDFGVERTVIYYRSESKRVASALNNKFFPMAEVKSAPQLADNVDIKVVLGRDLLPQQHAEAPRSRENKAL